MYIRRISAVSNAIQTIDNEANHLIIYCLNCIRHGRNATYEPGLSSPKYAKLGHFTSLFGRERQRNMQRFITQVHSYCSVH